MAEIALDGVTKRYDDGTIAVRELDLTVADGELLILVGPSGCGKSTALRMVAGLEDISDGEIRIGGEVVNDRRPQDRDLAMVFQNYALYPHMTVAENMGFSLKIAGVPRDEIRRRVEEVGEALQLTPYLDRKPMKLSGGQRQRVAMGRAVVRQPQAFLMDEPLSNLDASLRVEMRAEIARIQRRVGTTTLYVTHDQVEAMTLGDRVAVLRDGVLQQIAPPQELYDRPANVFVAGFIGSPAMNLVSGRLERDAVVLPFARAPLSAGHRSALGDAHLEPGREVVVGLRPEAFGDGASGEDGVTFEAAADVVESHGAEKYAYCTADGVRLNARLPASTAAHAGSDVRLRFDPGRLYLFDAESGRTLIAA